MSVHRIGRFVVRGELGAGGMGVVYRAEDPALGRAVALKLLPPATARNAQAREQLLFEARAAATLDHPNICTIYEVGEASDGELYVAMALYEGQTLERRLDHGRVTLAEATDIAIQIAQGLMAAHEVGLVHRDVKPSNVMLTRGGLVKILDFGIACAVAVDPDETGYLVAGTPRYMAPEQLTHAPMIDGGADAWALGVILYEMTTGDRPFHATDTTSLTHAVLFDSPAAPGTDTPEFRRVKPLVDGLLTKDRTRRLTLAEFLARAPRPAVPATDTPRPKSLAVLPFRSLGHEPDDAAFADGLTAEIITDLSKHSGLRVTSWTSAMHYRRSELKLHDIARELDVHYVLEGTLRRAGRALRITAHLADATNDAEIWADKYSGTLDDVFDMQERVSGAIADGLSVRLGTAEIAAAARPRINPEAYDLYLRARGEIWSFTGDGTDRAIALIDQALALAGPNALLLAARATALWQRVNTGAADLMDLKDAADTAAQALALDATSVPAMRVLALIAAIRGETATARAILTRALNAAGPDPETLSSGCVFFALTGDPDRAIALGRRATDIDPLYGFHWTALALAFATVGRDAEATAAMLRAFEIGPRDLPTRAIGPLILYGRGDLAPVFERLARADADASPMTGTYARMVQLTHAAVTGDRARALGLLTPDVERFITMGLHNALYGAEIFTLIGETERALASLARSAQLGLGCTALVATHSRTLAPLRAEPGFGDILRSIAAN